MTRETFYQLGLRLRRQQQRGWHRHDLAAQLERHKVTDLLALCCYFDAYAQTLTLGEAHFGLRSAARRDMQIESLSLCCYGVEVRIIDKAGLGLCERFRETLPPEFVVRSEPCNVSVAYVVTAANSLARVGASEFLITCDDVAVFATTVKEELYWWLRRDIDQVVARRSPHMLFVHAGVVSWRGVGIVIPGRSSIGKTTLVAALVRRGAVYYSDTFAVLDDAGRVHPYRGLLGYGVECYARNLRLVREDSSAAPLPIGLIVSGVYTPGILWRPTVVRGPYAALPLVDATVLARENTVRMPQIIAQVAARAVGLRGSRAEAQEVAARLLDMVDDVLVSRALGAAGDSLGRLADDLARVAEIRLRAPDGWIVSPPRHLIAACYVRRLDFLPPAEHQRLLQYVLSGESNERQDEIQDMFEQRLHAMLPFVRQQLEIEWFSLGQIEWQLTSHGRGSASLPRIDADTFQAAGPRILCIYYFHPMPRRFSGGELRLYDTWVTPTGTTSAGTATTLEPIDNSLVFFRRDTFHQVCPVYSETDAFADSSLAIMIREVDQPVLDSHLAGRAIDTDTNGVPAQSGELAIDADSAPALPSPAVERRAIGGPHSRRLVAVVVPAHRFPLSDDEQIAIWHLRTHLGEFDRYMIGPQLPPDEFSDFARPAAPACDFVDRVSYNRLMMSEQFYRAFEGYEYILIYQLDCLAFSNALEAWCRKGYDYIGAPWFERWHLFRSEQTAYPEDIVDSFGTVGNGGFSLRKVDAALAVLATTKQPLYDRLMRGVIETPGLGLHEDIFWSFHAPKLVDEFRIPKAREALQFSFETEPRYCYRENGHRLPFGCHGWAMWDREFWEPFLLR